VREAIFDVLGHLVEVEGASVVDLFAGSGALGIEALSRGAVTAVFVDISRGAVSTVDANLAATGLAGSRARVVRSDVVSWLRTPHHFDIALCDPPYAFEQWDLVLGLLDADVVVAETDHPLQSPRGWETARSKRYGGTLVTVVRRTSGDHGIGQQGAHACVTRRQKGSS
jgi:16S rRNA (guanine966-N2)-methyltransferase